MKRAFNIVAGGLLLFLIARQLGLALPGETPPIAVDQPSAVAIWEQTGDQSLTLQAVPGKLHDAFKGRARCLDDDLTLEQLKAESQWVRDAMALPRQGDKWLILATPRGGFSGPIPETIDELDALIGRYAQ